MVVAPSISGIPASNDTESSAGGMHSTLSIDGYVTTKFASLGSDVGIVALTRGHTANTLVTAEIIHYPDIDPIQLINSANLPTGGYVTDKITLVQEGVHEENADTMVWEGTYTIPVNSLGGSYGARIIAEDGSMKAVDDPTQLVEVFFGEIEKVLQAVDDAWESSNPTAAVKGEFNALDAKAKDNGGWSNFVEKASKGQGAGGSKQYWDAMINAGHNQYNMSEGADFLEALMEFLDSEDVDAGLATIVSLMVYADEFPIPREMGQFKDLRDHMMAFDPMENFTKFSGTEGIEDAYNALLGSNEWGALEEALENLAENEKQFESIQTILHNLALLAVSGHPEDLADAFLVWAEPLVEGDIENMTPFQTLVVRWIKMAEKIDEETDIQDTDGDEIPDVILWQYEKLLETTQGQAWTTKMATNSQWVNDAFDDFNSLPEDCINHVVDAFEESAWEDAGSAAEEYIDWMANASGERRHLDWPNHEGKEEEESNNEKTEGSDSDQKIIFDELFDMRTTIYDRNLLDLGVKFQLWGHHLDYPASFSITMTNDHGETVSTDLIRDGWDRYVGQMTASMIEDAVWSFSQPAENYQCVSTHSTEDCEIHGANLEIEPMRPSLLEAMSYEGVDEMFIVSALGVLVDQDEITSVASPYTVNTFTYDTNGIVAGAEVDVAVLRVSPDGAPTVGELLEPQGDVLISILGSSMSGTYDGTDLVGDLNATIGQFEERRDDDDRDDPPVMVQIANIEDEISITGSGNTWEAPWDPANDRLNGLVEVISEGTNPQGLDFRIKQVVPLPGTSGCAKSELSSAGEYAKLDLNYESFVLSAGEEGPIQVFDKPNLSNLTIDWGDGNTSSLQVSNGDWHEYSEHEYHVKDGSEMKDYNISVRFTDEDTTEVWHHYTYGVHKGVWKEEHNDDEEKEGEEEKRGNYMHSIKHGECHFDTRHDSMPSPQIIDQIITDGPVEVITEKIVTSDSTGAASITVSPTFSGVYLSIAQSKIVRNGETYTGVGLNLVAATDAEISLSGLTQETTFSGLPVYSTDSALGENTTVTFTPSGVQGEFTIWMGVAPLDLSIPFDGFDSLNWEAHDYEVEFKSEDTSKSQDIKVETPLSLIAVMVMKEDAIFPEAMHMGILTVNPGLLQLTGQLGPGQTTNVALGTNEGVASRILAVAAPTTGFDPASIDFSSFSDVIWREGVRSEVGWIPAEQEITEICENFAIWSEEHWNDATQKDETTVRIKLEMKHRYHYFKTDETVDTTNTKLMKHDVEIQPIEDWNTSPEGESVAVFDLDMYAEEEYTLHTNTENPSSEFRFTIRDGYIDTDDDNSRGSCSGDTNMNETEVFDMFDEIFGDLNSIAWGQGSSADLRLPLLSSPSGEYTIIAVAQKGTGASASIVSAIGSQLALPNPAPTVIKNLTLSFSPPNPMPGDTVLVTVTDDSSSPVDDLSVIVTRDGTTLFSIRSDANGQATFEIPVGTLIVTVVGNGYHSVNLTITVSDAGIVITGPDSSSISNPTPGTNSTSTDGGAKKGCTYPTATNYDPTATLDDGSCVMPDGTSPTTTTTNSTSTNETATTTDVSSEQAEGGFVPAPGLIAAIFSLLGSSVLLRRSKDD